MKTMTISSDLLHERSSKRATFGKPNVGGSDRVLRAILGGVLLANGVYGTGPLGLDAVLIMLSIPLIISAIIAWDPFYAMLKVRTATLRIHAVPYRKALKLNADGGINVGTVDRISRIAIAGVLLATPFLLPGAVGVATVAAVLAGIVVMLTAVTGWDPIYAAMNVRTATLPIETAPTITTHSSVGTLTLIDEVVGEDDDVYQKAA